MSKIIKINKFNVEATKEDDDSISIKIAAKILGWKYNVTYNLIKYTDKITKYDYGPRNLKASKASVIAYKNSHKITGEF